MFERKRYEEAKSVGFYIITFFYAVFIGLSIILILTLKPDWKMNENLITSIIAASGAMLAVSIAVFTLYFSFNMDDNVKEILLEFGFYFQLPKDMLRSAAIFGLSIISSIVSLFFQNIMRNVLGFIAILNLFYGITIVIFVTFRFLKVIKMNLREKKSHL